MACGTKVRTLRCSTPEKSLVAAVPLRGLRESRERAIPTIEKTLQDFERTFKRRPHAPREVFTASECPVCLQLQRPTMLFPCNHGVCEGCFRDLGAIVAPLAGQLHVNSISFFHVRNFTLENMSQPHEVTWKES